MTPRLDPYAHAPDLLKQMIAFSTAAANSGLEPSLVELVKIRASQVNGCARCLEMHTAEARRAGESELRIYMLDAWRESALYSPRERAALAWTEALTRLAETRAPDADYALTAAEFSEEERVKLTWMIIAINSWNRLAVGFRLGPMEAPAKAAA